LLVDEYIEHLYQQDLEGYVQVLQLANDQVVKIINTQYKGMCEVVHEMQQEPDTFITPNSFYKPQRTTQNIRHYRALYLDLDLKIHSKTEAFYNIYLLVSDNEIPKPTMIVDSGRGLHLYWRIEHAPKQANYTWQMLEDFLYHKLKHLGADIQATDASRLLRLPTTINTKNNAVCRVLEVNDQKYSMYDLRENYLQYKQEQSKTKKRNKTSKKASIKQLFNSYTLHQARSNDLLTLCDLRDYEVVGYRNSILHCFVYWQGIYIRELDRLEEVAEQLNQKFREPLKMSEVKAIVRSANKAIERFIDYVQGVNSGKDKRVSKAMRNRGGYWYTNDRLIEMLNITEQEQKHLKTIIDKQEKYKRNNERRRQERRNEQGLTSREQQKLDTINQVKELAEQGYSNSAIARKLDISRRWVVEVVNYQI